MLVATCPSRHQPSLKQASLLDKQLSYTQEEVEEARRFFPTMTDEQLVGLIEAVDFFQNRLLDDYFELNEYESERYSEK